MKVFLKCSFGNDYLENHRKTIVPKRVIQKPKSHLSRSILAI